MSHDLRFQFGSPPPLRRGPRRGPWLLVAAFLLLLVLGALYYYRHSSRERPRSLPSPPPIDQDTVSGRREPLGEPGVELPPLDASDGFVRARLRGLSRASLWADLLAADDLVRRFVTVVSAVAEGRSPRGALDQVVIVGPFAVRAVGAKLIVDPSSFARYDRIAAVLGAVDVAAVRPVWQMIRPLAEQAWAEVAPPGEALEDAIAKAIDHLLAAPLPPADVEVHLQDGLYRYADPMYESLTPAQKHLVRMGRINAGLLRGTLRDLRRLLTP